MAAIPILSHVRLPPVPIAAVAVGAIVSAVVMLVPAALLESLIVAGGIPAPLPAVEPPLGHIVRLVLSVAAGAGSAAATWFAGRSLPGTHRPAAARPLWRRSRKGADALPVLRRADAHPDAPARAPLMAGRDLGTPLTAEPRKPKPVPLEQDLPRDLDMPLSAFDPDAIPDVPARPIPVAGPLARVRAPSIGRAGERFASRPPRAAIDVEAAPPIATPRTDATIHALLDRLERGIGRRAAPGGRTPPPVAPTATNGGLADTLEELRRLAVRGAA